MSSVAISCVALRSGYGETEVLHEVGLEIRSGDIYALMGKNGAGKTTLLLTVLGVIRPRSGRIQVFGVDVVGWPTHRIIKKGVACAPQESSFFQDLTVDDNLRLGSLHLTSHAFQRGRDRVIEMFPFLGSRLQQKAGTLSGGEQAMAKVARALLPEPDIILLDEVTEGLQPLTVERVRDVLVREHEQRRITLLVVEQNVDFVAGLANRYGLMERGMVFAEGALSDSDAATRISKHLSI